MALNLDGTTDYLTPNFIIFTNSNFAGVSWVIGLIIAALSMVLITRSPDKWKKLALPLMAGWHMLGITNSFIILILAGIVYVADALTFSGATNPLTIFTTAAKQHDYNVAQEEKRIFNLNKLIRQKRRKDVFTKYQAAERTKDIDKVTNLLKIKGLLQRQKEYNKGLSGTNLSMFNPNEVKPIRFLKPKQKQAREMQIETINKRYRKMLKNKYKDLEQY